MFASNYLVVTNDKLDSCNTRADMRSTGGSCTGGGIVFAVGGDDMRQIKVTMLPNNDIPAFAGYLSGSVRDPSAEIVINFEAMVNSAADRTNAPLTFEEIFTTSVAHELMHVIQDFYQKNFDEEEVERVVEEAARLFYGEDK